MKKVNAPYEDFKINVKLKLAGLWTALMFCYVYGDFFTLFVPGHLQSMMTGHSGIGKTTPLTLLLFAVLLSVPAVMIFLSLLLTPGLNRLLNILAGILFTLIMCLTVATSLEASLLFYIYLGILEIGITILIVCTAWRWPR
jgi:hypothetical protein